MKKLTAVITAAAVLLFAFSLIYYSKEVSEGMIRSLRVCLDTILPSLYAFMVVSGFIISSGLYKVISRPFGFIARRVFRIKEEYFSVFLLSSAAGYPVGAKLLSDLYSQDGITREEAEKMLGWCYMGGPAFFCGVAGTGIYGEARIGVIIFLCIFTANILTGILSGLSSPVPEKTAAGKSKPEFTLSGFLGSVTDGGIGIAKICAAIVFFSSASSVLEASGVLSFIAGKISVISGTDMGDCLVIIRSLLEISNISALSPKPELIPVVTALLSFGGLCVIMQTEGVIGGRLSTRIFYLYRIFSIFISYFCCKILLYIIDIDRIIQASSDIRVGYRHNSPIPSVFLLIMTILLLSNNYIVKNKNV